MQIAIPYGKERVKVDVPEPYEILVPNQVKIKDQNELIEKALKNPIGKESFEKRKQERESRKKQKRTQVKEMKFRPGTEEGDYQVKLRNLVRFLESGDKAKVTLRFRGREMAHQEIGMELLKRVEADLAELGSVEQFPKMEGRQLTMVIAPKKKN